jgi:threonine aldolase
MTTHMDGARLLNAAVATGIPARDMAAGWDSVWIDFSKGLGAPIGGAIAGTRAFIDEIWRWKQRLGGSMRQAGVCAAACVHALDHHVERLAEDHANARALLRPCSLDGAPFVSRAPDLTLVKLQPTTPRTSKGHFVKGAPKAKTAGRARGTPNRTTVLLKQAIIDAAEQVGLDGRGKEGLVGYLKMLALTEKAVYARLL